MTPRLFTGLTFAAVGSLLLAAVVHTQADTWVSGTPSGAKLLPSLQRDMPRLAAITVKQGGQSVTLERKGEAWSLKDRGGYPVQGDRVRALLVKLADAEIVDRKTRNPERFNLLELEEPTLKDAKSRVVSMTDSAGKSLVDLIVGKRSVEQFAAGKGGTYVRRPGEKDTWLVSTEIDVNTAVNQWVDTTVFEAEIAKVKRVEINVAGEPQLVIEREAGKPANKDGYKLLGMPEGKKLKSEYALEDMVNAFARVELEDVRRPVAPPADAPAPNTASYATETGAKFTLKVRSEGDQRWAVVEATGEGDGKDVADKVNARTAGWEFRLPSWKYDQIFKKQADLVEDAKS